MDEGINKRRSGSLTACQLRSDGGAAIVGFSADRDAVSPLGMGRTTRSLAWMEERNSLSVLKICGLVPLYVSMQLQHQ